MMVSLKREREDEVDDDDNEETGKCMITYGCPMFHARLLMLLETRKKACILMRPQ